MEDALADELRRLKSEAGLSFTQLAERSWCSRSSLERYLNGRAFPPRQVAKAVSDACGGDTTKILAAWDRARAARDKAAQSAVDTTRTQSTEAPRPKQLPLDIRNFTGRDELIAVLDGLLDERATHTADRPGIAAIVGTAGVGKTALAIHWAHRIADRFPDGQLWIDLHGFDPKQLVTPVHALGVLLRALGVPGSALPPDVEGLSGLFRSLLADRRVLLVLDNAHSAEQVRPLLPGGAGCLVLVTSRDTLTGLVARDGATRLTVDLFSMSEAVTLLRRIVGSSLVDTHAADIQAVAALCARLPLALRIAAERIDRDAARLGALVAELSETSPLEAFAVVGDPFSAIRAVFSWSYRALPIEAAALFRRLGTLPMPHFDEYIAAAAMGTSVLTARRLLAVLVNAHLLDSRGTSRTHMHDLLRAFAAERARAEDADEVQRVAVGRVLDYFHQTVVTAVNLAFPNERRHVQVPALTTPQPSLADSAAALSWLDGERDRLLPAAIYASTRGWHSHAVDFAALLYRYLIVGAHHRDALTLHRHALAAAETADDKAGLADALHNLGSTYWLLGCQTEAHEHFERALGIFRVLADNHGEARALGNLGNVYWRWGRNDDAYGCYQQAQAVFVDAGDVCAQAMTLLNLGELRIGWGQYELAFQYCQEALELYRAVDDAAGEASSRKLIGDVHLRLGRWAEALEEYEAVLEIGRRIGHRRIEAYALDGLGGVSARRRAYDHAVALHEQALSVRRECGDQFGELDTMDLLAFALHQRGDHVEAADQYQRAFRSAQRLGRRGIEPRLLNGLGEVALSTAAPERALARHGQALTLARKLGDRYERARALFGLARANRALDNRETAAENANSAWSDFADLKVPEAAEVRAWLERPRTAVTSGQVDSSRWLA